MRDFTFVTIQGTYLVLKVLFIKVKILKNLPIFQKIPSKIFFKDSERFL